jgi:hypothetical protein
MELDREEHGGEVQQWGVDEHVGTAALAIARAGRKV